MMCLWDLPNTTAYMNGDALAKIMLRNSLPVAEITGLEGTTLRVLMLGGSLLTCFRSNDKPAAAKDSIMHTLKGLERLQNRIIEILDVSNSPIGYCTQLGPYLGPPNAAFFKLHFGIFDICHAIKRVLDNAITWNQDDNIVEILQLEELSARMQALRQDCRKKVENHVIKLQDGLRTNHALEYIVKAVYEGQAGHADPTSVELKELIGRSDMQDFAKELRDSWVDALDGIVEAARYLGSN